MAVGSLLLGPCDAGGAVRRATAQVLISRIVGRSLETLSLAGNRITCRRYDCVGRDPSSHWDNRNDEDSPTIQRPEHNDGARDCIDINSKPRPMRGTAKRGDVGSYGMATKANPRAEWGQNSEAKES
jgi:hypothetical protein